MRAAIAAARGPKGLKGKDANALNDALSKFDQAINDQDAGQAQDAANKVATQVADLVDHGGITDPAAAQLQAAANRLVAAAKALPD
jgi:ribosomal protein S20